MELICTSEFFKKLKLHEPLRLLSLLYMISLAYKISHCLSANHYPELRCVICTGVTLFALVLHLNCTALSQSELSIFFMCIINNIILFLSFLEYNCSFRDNFVKRLGQVMGVSAI